jgi:effector-binding domain-containing protein
MPEFEIRSIPRQHTAAVRMSSPLDGIGEAMGEAFPKVFAAIGKAGGTPAGPPLARYFEMGPEVVEFECAIPIATPFEADGEVRPSEVGGGEAAVAMHAGPYDTIGQTWEAVTTWIGKRGRTPAGPGWESYLTDPSEEPDPAKYLTEVCLPVE